MKMGVIKFAYGIILALAGISFAVDCPVFAPTDVGHYTVYENSPQGLVVATIPIENVNSDTNLTFEIISGDAQNWAAKMFETRIDGETGGDFFAQVLVKNSNLLDFESKPHSYMVSLTLKGSGSLEGCQDSLIRTIDLIDVNESPKFKYDGYTTELYENPNNGEIVKTLDVLDPDTYNVSKFGHLDFKILGDNVPFAMDSNRIVVSDASRLNYEQLNNPRIGFYVEVANCLGNSEGTYTEYCLYDTVSVTVVVKDDRDPPYIDVDADKDGYDDFADYCLENCDTTNRGNGDRYGDNILVIGVDKNALEGTAVFEYVVTDEDDGQVSDLTATLTDVYALRADTLFNVRKIKHGDVWTVGVYVAKTGCLKSENLFRDYTLKVTVRDSDGKKDEIRRVVRLLNVAEKSSSSIASSSSAKSSSSVASSSSVRSSSSIVRSSSSVVSSSSARSSSSVVRSSSSAVSSSSVHSSSSVVKSSSSVASSSSIRSSSSMVRVSSSSLARYSSSSRNGMSSSSRDEIRSSSTLYMELSSSSSSRMDWSSSSLLEIASSSSNSRNDVNSSSSSHNDVNLSSAYRNDISSSSAFYMELSSPSSRHCEGTLCGPEAISSSSRGFFIRVSSSSEMFIDPRARRSSSSTEYFGDVFAEPSFRVKFLGPFQIVIVMDAPIASVTNRNFAVMDLQGRVLRQGTVYTTETIVQGLGKGSYVVKVGLGVRRVNIQ